MPRFTADFLTDLKAAVPCERFLESRNVALTRSGTDLVGHCPLPGHDDDTPSFRISEKDGKSLWHCFGGCGGGDVISLVQKLDDVSFTEAVILLASLAGMAVPDVQRSTVRPAGACPIDVSARGLDLSRHVVDAYHAQLLQPNNQGRAYLKSRELDDDDLIAHFRLGYAERGTLGKQIPDKKRAAGAAVRDELEKLGWFNEKTGHETLAGSIVVPLFGADGESGIAAYGRKIRDNLRKGTPTHLYLKGQARPLFNAEHCVSADGSVIVCEALLDALTFWKHGFQNVTTSYGVNGFNNDWFDILRRKNAQEIVIAYDNDDAGNNAAEVFAEQCIAAGFTALRAVLPAGRDVNAAALQAENPQAMLSQMIADAQWLGGTAAVPAVLLAGEENNGQSNEQPEAIEKPALPAGWKITADDNGDVCAQHGSRRWRLRGLDKCRAGSLNMRVQMRLSVGDFYHQDVLDLAQKRGRAAFSRAAADETSLPLDVINGDLAQLLLLAEEWVEKAKDAENNAQQNADDGLSDAQRALGEAYLKDPDLLDNITRDITACGLIGEDANKLLGYICATSRLLPRPLAVVVQSSSSAGKSSLMDGILKMMPSDHVHRYASLSEQVLFYMSNTDLRHRILAVAEDNGLEDVAYVVKLLISDGHVSRMSTAKDADTGALVSKAMTVEGPTQVFLTTTALDVHDELMNRCMVLAVDENDEQTAHVLAAQRLGYTADGYAISLAQQEILALHHAAQRCLRPLPVVNPYATQLTYCVRRVEDRRDHRKYLDLINAIAFVHQYQRKTVEIPAADGSTIEAIEVALEDIAAANTLFTHVYGRPLADLPAHTVRVLYNIHDMQKHSRNSVFTRRELKEFTGLSMTALRRHLERLVDEELIVPMNAPARGQITSYQCDFDPALVVNDQFCAGLLSVDALEYTYDEKVTPQTANLTPPKHSQNTPKTQPKHSNEITVLPCENGEKLGFSTNDEKRVQGGVKSQFPASQAKPGPLRGPDGRGLGQ